MGKNINDIAIVVQARLNSQRIPQKMLKPFAESTLLGILLEKLKTSRVIPKENIHLSVYEKELVALGTKHQVKVFPRSQKSANEEKDIKVIFEWYDKLPYKYVVLISACNPLLKIETVDMFIEAFLNSDKEGGFGVFEKKTYYWDQNGNSVTDWKGLPAMNTKFVDPVYEAGHCLYASRMDIIKEGYWLDRNSPMDLELFKMDELETFDIDYEWQFKVGETLYRELWKK